MKAFEKMYPKGKDRTGHYFPKNKKREANDPGWKIKLHADCGTSGYSWNAGLKINRPVLQIQLCDRTCL